MSLAHSPSVVTNGLVMYYDMGNPQKSWKGAPTINLFGTNLSATNAVRTINNNGYAGTYAGWTATGIANDNPRITLFNGSVPVLPSIVYTFSCLYWSSNNVVDDVYLRFTDSGWPEGNVYFQPFTPQSITRNGSFSITDLGGGLKFCSGTYQTLSTTTTLAQLFFDVDVAGVEVFITNIQLEQQTFATPFVAGTRSNTQAIVDLTGNNTITANTSISYLSDSTFEFLPSNNTSTLTVPLSTCLNKLTGTISTWVYPRGYSSSNGIFVNRENSTSNALDWLWIGTWSSGSIFYFRLGNGIDCCSQDLTVSGWSTICPVNKWSNISVTWQSGSFSKIYVNGNEIASRTITSIPSTNPSTTGRIGLGHGSTEGGSWNGLISNFSIFNRALSAAEVQQNFNALRGRYGL